MTLITSIRACCYVRGAGARVMILSQVQLFIHNIMMGEGLHEKIIFPINCVDMLTLVSDSLFKFNVGSF